MARKSSRLNVDDTETEDDTDSCEAAVGPNVAMDEWKTYLNTKEDVPEEMGIVRWWGVSGTSSVSTCE
jgi:hypothetical protein